MIITATNQINELFWQKRGRNLITGDDRKLLISQESDRHLMAGNRNLWETKNRNLQKVLNTRLCSSFEDTSEFQCQ